MATQWKQLTADEVKNHPSNEKGGLKTLIKLFCFFTVGSMGMAASSVAELYKTLEDVSQLPPENSAINAAILPSLVFAIIWGCLIKSKTKNTLKIVIVTLWVSLFISFIHSMIFFSYLGFSVPNETTLGFVGNSIWVIILTIGLVIYSYVSDVYNLQYLHRVRIVDNQAQKISPNLDIIQEDSNLKAEDEESKTTVLEKVSVINSQEASYNKKMQNTKSMSANLNKYLLVACSVVIIIASPFCIVEYRNNLECIEKERIYEANWEEQFQIYKIEYEQWLAEGESRITKEYKECKLRQKPSDESNNAFAKYLNNFDFCGSSRTTAERDLYNARNATLEDIKNEYSKINNRYSGMFCQ